MLAGTDSGLFVSSDSGASWISLKNNLKNTGAIFLVRKGPDIYAGTSRGVFSSSDEGVTWVQHNSGLGDTIIRTLVTNGTTLFVGTLRSGVYRLNDSDTTWKSLAHNLPDLDIGSLTLNDKYLFAATDTIGIWRYPLNQLNTVDQKPRIGQGLVLYPNYPNPFSTQTTIAFSTSRKQFVDVKIIDLLGKGCAHLYSGELETGDHFYELDGSLLTKGVYFCIIRTADGIEKQMIVSQ